uniref:Mothers against decapentaplegic homolog n=1 Tax=Ditylenchus dipsaci TaxID=166011 RepID=A0A915D962_9BILA
MAENQHQLTNLSSATSSGPVPDSRIPNPFEINFTNAALFPQFLNQSNFLSRRSDEENSAMEDYRQPSVSGQSICEDISLNASASHHQLPPTVSNDPCGHVVHVLLCYHQGGEDPEFIRKAIESLVKKLKDRRMQLDALISAVTSGGKQPTGCVTIHRSLDGRLQVAGRKGVPHVVYARIWRWPNVNKNELQKLPVCTTSNDDPDLICINPFHYDRIVSSGIGSIEMSSLKMDPLGNCKMISDMPDYSSQTPQMSTFESSSSQMDVDREAELMNDVANDGSSSKIPFLMFGHDQQPSYVVSHLASGSTISNKSLPNFHQQPTSFTEMDHANFQQREELVCPNGSGKGDPGSIHNTFGLQRYNNLRYNLDHVRIPSSALPEHWCSILYYELDTQVGETFKAPRDLSEVIVDGGMDPSGARSGRFCLGALSNVHRTEASEKASYFLDFEHGLIYGSTVHKFCSGAEKKLFDLRWAFAEMCEQRESAQMAVVAQAYAVAGIVQRVAPSLIERAGIGVDDLRRVCCTIAISFVKGWDLATIAHPLRKHRVG